MVLKEGTYASDQATSDTSCEYGDFVISCDKYVEIFNAFMRRTRATQYFDVFPKISYNSYTFKKRGVLSTLGVFKPKDGKGHTRFVK